MALLRSIVLSAVANALSLALAAWLFEGFSVTAGWFVLAVVVFTVLTVVLRRTVFTTVPGLARGYTVAGGLVLALAALAVTDLVVPHDGFAIDGLWTWVGVTLVVWAAGVAYGEIDRQAPADAPGVASV